MNNYQGRSNNLNPFYFPQYFGFSQPNFPNPNFLIEEILMENKKLSIENSQLKTALWELQARLSVVKQEDYLSIPPFVHIQSDCTAGESHSSYTSTKNPLLLNQKDDSSIFDSKKDSPLIILENNVSPITSQRQCVITTKEEEESVFKSSTEEVNSLESADSDEYECLSKKRKTGITSTKIGKKSKDKDVAKSRLRSKAKHLWISYGRKIIEYSLNNTKGKMKEEIEKYDQKLISKKAYSDVFRIKKKDSDDTIKFKQCFGKLALEFIEKNIDDAFPNSNYREELLEQREKVEKWISRLISV